MNHRVTKKMPYWLERWLDMYGECRLGKNQSLYKITSYTYDKKGDLVIILILKDISRVTMGDQETLEFHSLELKEYLKVQFPQLFPVNTKVSGRSEEPSRSSSSLQKAL
jgi:hypothetical protein